MLRMEVSLPHMPCPFARASGTIPIQERVIASMSTANRPFWADCRIVLGSMNAALRAQRLLSGAGLRSTVVKTQGSQRGDCLYGLSVACPEHEAALRVLRERGIRTLFEP